VVIPVTIQAAPDDALVLHPVGLEPAVRPGHVRDDEPDRDAAENRGREKGGRAVD